MTQVLVGATLPQFSNDRLGLLDAARAAERAGLDSLWLFDHLWPLSGGKSRPILECWTTLAWLAAATDRIRIGTLVTRSTLREPALLAKMAASVGAIAPGRLIVTLGSGDEMSRAENEAFGLPYFEADERIAQLEATTRVVHGYLRSEEVTHSSPFIDIARLDPSPRSDPRPELWLGGRSDDVLSLAGRYADGWNGWGGSPERFAQDVQQVLFYAGGRAIELSWGGILVLAGSDGEARRLLGEASGGDRIVGGPGSVAASLGRFVRAGARHVIATPAQRSADADFYGHLGEVRRLLSN